MNETKKRERERERERERKDLEVGEQHRRKIAGERKREN